MMRVPEIRHHKNIKVPDSGNAGGKHGKNQTGKS